MRPWDEVVHVNSARLTGLALTQSTQQERGPWCRPTNQVECEARGTASSASLLSSDLFRKNFLRAAAAGAAEPALPYTTGFCPTPTHLSSNSSKIAGDHSVKGVALSKLRRSDASRHRYILSAKLVRS